MYVLTLNLIRSQLKNKKIGPASPPITKVPHFGRTLQPAHNATVPMYKKKSKNVSDIKYKTEFGNKRGAGLSSYLLKIRS